MKKNENEPSIHDQERNLMEHSKKANDGLKYVGHTFGLSNCGQSPLTCLKMSSRKDDLVRFEGEVNEKSNVEKSIHVEHTRRLVPMTTIPHTVIPLNPDSIDVLETQLP